MKRRMAWMLASAVLAGCASPAEYSTPSGRPEGRFPDASIAQVSAEIIRHMTSAGGTLSQQTANQLVFQDKSDSTLDSVLFGTRYDFDVYGRVRFTLYDADGAVVVIADCAMVQNAGSAFEKATDATHTQDCAGAQGLLDLIGRDLASR